MEDEPEGMKRKPGRKEAKKKKNRFDFL